MYILTDWTMYSPDNSVVVTTHKSLINQSLVVYADSIHMKNGHLKCIQIITFVSDLHQFSPKCD